MTLKHHQLHRLLATILMGCLCFYAFQTASATGSSKAIPAAKRKPQHLSAKKKQHKPVTGHKAWTEREPTTHEFISASSSINGYSPSVTQEKVPPSIDAKGDLIALTEKIAIFQNQHQGTQLHRRNIATDTSSEPLYDSSPGAYAFGPASFELNYERQNDRALEATRDFLSGKRQFGINQNRFIESPLDRDAWHVGMNYAIGKGSLNAAVDYTRMRNSRESAAADNTSEDLRSITFGYTHNVSENTSFYGSITHTEYDTGNDSNTSSTPAEDSNINQVNVGIKHRF